ncbi:hypothetical protein [Cloacibacillus sp. An23]|uniref:DUF7173 family protein n=1 Tax=Cloacibacillus sp. An23 TaxID=1965591 RepID=UPI000B3A6F9B|nr:hypothetical protein [Cloacibacillus sp. An23]OUO92589.1 hypothetical protein B5F39_10545 [Cloacibacillus sp. An23]
MTEATYELIEDLYEAKAAEDAAKAKRVALEAELAKALEVPEQWEGSQTRTVNEYKVCVKRAINVKIDAAQLQDITVRYGLKEEADKSFRWKAELDKKGWNSLNPMTQNVFAAAITKTPGKVSITVELKKEDK